MRPGAQRAAVARRCGARYAVLFASNVCFLRRETIDKNEDSVEPSMLAEHYAKQQRFWRLKSMQPVAPPAPAKTPRR